MKVKGFQVAPAELEGHLLDHPDVADVCVVGVPDDYSGELPLAFVVPSEPARARIQQNPREGEQLKAALVKVCFPPTLSSALNPTHTPQLSLYISVPSETRR